MDSLVSIRNIITMYFINVKNIEIKINKARRYAEEGIPYELELHIRNK